MTHAKALSDTDLDFVRETMNIAAGNAAVAFCQMLGAPVDVSTLQVRFLPTITQAQVLRDPSAPVACASMHMVGDVTGVILFLVPEVQTERLTDLALKAAPGHGDWPLPDKKRAVLVELANVLAGVFLTAIHDFCEISICHTVPAYRVDMPGAMMDESLSLLAAADSVSLMVETVFSAPGVVVRADMLVIPAPGTVGTLTNALLRAREKLTGAHAD
jgi:chemotaxis protein CheC